MARHPTFLGPTTGLLALVLFAGGPVSAGPFTPNGTQMVSSHLIASPSDCGGCHDFGIPGESTAPYTNWAGSMMANAARDPVFWAALDVANADVPGVGDFCLRCHVPTGWLEGRVQDPGTDPNGVTGCNLDGPIDQPDNDFMGVSCHLCHRMMINDSVPPPDDVYTENAQFWIDDTDCTDPDGGGSGPCRRGPYDYQAVGENTPPHIWTYSAYHQSSQICGNCHNVTNPVKTLIDESGTDTGIPYPIERTFKEWQQSALEATTTCQNCHMPDAMDSPAYACVQQSNDRAGNLPVHVFAGGNAWIPTVLQGEYPTLLRDPELAATAAAAQAMLQSAASVEVAVPAEWISGEDLPVSVRVTNLSGHKLPTGYTEGRRMWLQLEARDGDGTLLWESGAYDAATGILTEDAQIKLYHSLPGIWSYNGTGQCDVTDDLTGDPLFHFVLNDCIALDNRIPPAGFTGMADDETRPVGYSYPETSPGSGILVHWDDTAYDIPVPIGTPGPISVDARLLYQTSSKEYVEFLRDNDTDPGSFPTDCLTTTFGLPALTSRGEFLHTLWQSYGRSAPVEMVTVSDSVTLDLFADGFESGDVTRWSASAP